MNFLFEVRISIIRTTATKEETIFQRAEAHLIPAGTGTVVWIELAKKLLRVCSRVFVNKTGKA